MDIEKFIWIIKKNKYEKLSGIFTVALHEGVKHIKNRKIPCPTAVEVKSKEVHDESRNSGTFDNVRMYLLHR